MKRKKILKFGGTSVGSLSGLQSIVEILQRSQPAELLAVVVSAPSGVTDDLLRAAQQARAGDAAYAETMAKIASRYFDLIHEAFVPQQRARVLSATKADILQVEEVIKGIAQLGELSPRVLGYILSFGEAIHAPIVAAYLQQQGIQAAGHDAREFIFTDQNFASAQVLWDKTVSTVRSHFKNLSELPVVTGFIAKAPNDETTTLGRGGSDYTAAILANALDATDLEIWTDVDGFMSADPRYVNDALTIAHLTYEEAMELATFGAKVLYPPTMRPAVEKKITIHVRNTFNNSHPGTYIDGNKDKTGPVVTGLSAIKDIALLRLEGSGLIAVAGTSARVFSILGQHHISVILISQASSEHSICFAVKKEDAAAAQSLLQDAFADEINGGKISAIACDADCAIVAVVGEQMRERVGVSGRTFRAMGRNGVNLKAIAQGSSERNLSAVISAQDLKKALNAVHDEFFIGSRRTINIFIIGAGTVGKELIDQIRNQRERLQQRGIHINICGIARQRRFSLDSDALASQLLDQIKWQDGDLNDFMDGVLNLNLPQSVVVDCTASDEPVQQHQKLLENNIAVVTANKKVVTQDYMHYRLMKETAQRRGVSFLYETCVGAGLPVINTLQDLLHSGDEVIQIDAVLSGTLSYVMNTLDGSKPFSEVLKQAQDLGYTEPDPRIDLSGMDVARKAIILARECGMPLEMTDVKVDNLCPEDCMNVPLDQFYTALEKHDDAFMARLKDVQAKQQKFCYVARVSKEGLQVGLQAIGAEHPFYSLSGSDNMMVFKTLRYNNNPLVIRGPGAGAAVTAAGVFGDILRVIHHD